VALTSKGISKLLKRPGRHHDGHGLYLQITSPTSASWLLRYEFRGRERMLGLGPLHVIGLKEARERARVARLLMLDGIDPVEDRKAKKAEHALAAAKAMTFGAAAEAYHTQHEARWRNHKHRAQFLSTLRQHAGPLHPLPVASIDTGLVLKVLEPIWPTTTETASRVRGRIESVLDWCAVRNLRSGDNPARWTGHLDQVLPARSSIAKVEHHPALAYVELPAFMAELRTRPGSAPRALEFCILTAARTAEIIGAQWSEIDLTNATWTVPAGRMKGSREHRVTLSAHAIELLQELPREDDNPYLFIGMRHGLSDNAMAQVNRAHQ
jgi:integrase